MPERHGLRPLKSWRYVAAFDDHLMLCAAAVRIGRARQAFWAVWDRRAGRLHERTNLGPGAVRLGRGRLQVKEGSMALDLTFDEEPGIEVVCQSGASYAWTRKQGGVRAHGSVSLPGKRRELDGRAVIDDTAGYYERHTGWSWSAGVGHAADGRALAWNLVEGVNDPPHASERTVWIDDTEHEVAPVRFAPDLSCVEQLRFHAEAVREERTNLLLVRSSYRQPFGTFSGRLPGGDSLPQGIDVAEGLGVMEEHDVFW